MQIQVISLVICAVLSAAVAEVFFEEKFTEGTYWQILSSTFAIVRHEIRWDFEMTLLIYSFRFLMKQRNRCDTTFWPCQSVALSQINRIDLNFRINQFFLFFTRFHSYEQTIGKTTGYTAKLKAKNSVNSNWPLANSTTMLKMIKVCSFRCFH